MGRRIMKSLERFGDDNSQYREQMVEYIFLSELTQHLAKEGRKLEILRGHSDSYGYDLVLKVDEVTKYVQLKSVKKSGRVPNWKIHKSLLQRDNGTVVLVVIEYADVEMQLKYRVLNEKKRDSVQKKKFKSKPDSEKYCRISRGDFHQPKSIKDLASALFPVA